MEHPASLPSRPFALPVPAVRAALVALVVVASLAILSTARTFSGTVDEPAHIAAGMQWLSTGAYDYDLQHPPLGRIATAIVPYLHGTRSTGTPGIYDEGAKVLGAGPHYVETLAQARHGVIVFFLLLSFAVWVWARRLLGDIGAAIATLLTVTNPNILAHSGLATTDVACAATTTLALLAAAWWIDRPTISRSIVFGLALAVAIDSRLSAIAFIGAALVVCYVARGIATRVWSLGLTKSRSLASLGMTTESLGMTTVVSLGTITVATLFGIWAAYRFAIGPMPNGGPTVPAPAFVEGLRVFLLHGSTGHPSFLLGTPSNHGWWYYFPVALAVKTPLPLLLLSIAGGMTAFKQLRDQRDWQSAVPMLSAVAILGISILVRVDLGVRLILPMYPLMAIVGAQGALDLWRQNRSMFARGFTSLVVASSAFIVVRSYPDMLAYFNPLAGDQPERVLVDSNLDWGQDLYRLRDTLAARGITDSVYVAYFGTADLSAAGMSHARLLGLHEVRPGWIAASQTYLSGEWVGGAYQWLKMFRPTAKVGPSLLLWHIPATGKPTTDSLPR